MCGFAVAELRRGQRGAGKNAAPPGPEEETAGQPAASAGVHHLVSAQRRQHGETSGKDSTEQLLLIRRFTLQNLMIFSRIFVSFPVQISNF